MNKLCDILGKIRRYGVSGIYHFIVSRYEDRCNHRFFFRHCSAATTPTRGITLVGSFTHGAGLSKTLRDFAFSLKDAGIPFQTFDTNPNPRFPTEDIAPILTPRAQFDSRKYSHEIEMINSPFPCIQGVHKSRIAFWEATTGFAEAFPNTGNCHAVIGMSDFNVQCFRNELKGAKVVKILYPFRFIRKAVPARDITREKYGIAHDAFAVFFNFDFNSFPERKNPHGAMTAFAKAFRHDPNAILIFKTMHAKQNANEMTSLTRLAHKLGIDKRFMHISSYIPQVDLYGLTNACDVYLSLHRGEGFGLGIAEAMSLGKPVVVTNYSSTTEFCNNGNSIPIEFKMVPLTKEQRSYPTFSGIKEWAEPNIDDAANALIKLRNDPEFAHQLGERAAASLHNQFSLENFKASVNAFLDS